MNRKALVALATLAAVFVLLPGMAMAQDGAAATNENDVNMWKFIAAGFAMAIASSVCGIAQGRSVIAACEGMARNPSAGGQIRGTLIIGLVLIESLAIYTLLISLIIMFQ